MFSLAVRRSLVLLPLLALAACGKTEPPASPETTAAANDTVAAAAAEETVAAAMATPQVEPANWPLQQPPLARDPAAEQRIADLLARMTLEEKVGQVIQADIDSVTPEQVREFNLGSILNGGGSAPGKDLRGAPESWLELADAFWEASTDTSDGGVGIPAIWGTDAVHGHSNIVGATIFPHNIGLGAANDPDLVYEIGRVTALEILVTGLDWTFAPTVAVARNDRWGRTYESFSEDPRIVAAYSPRVVEGLQGVLGTDDFLGPDRVIATAKHFVGDGGTVDGRDQGDNRSSEADFRDVHAAGYPPAIAVGVQTVMASFSSFHGRKLHGYRELLHDVLVGRMGFDGFVVGDWNGHGQVEGCSPVACAASFNAGLDLFMAPNSWQELYENTLQQLRQGLIAEERLDEAVARILRVKIRAGILDAPRPSERKHAGNWVLLGAPEHRALARQAVRKSLVLLKNENQLLPLPASARILVTGPGAHDIGKQSGGWTLSWQGTGNSREHFPHGESVFEGLAAALEVGGGQAVLSEDGNWFEAPEAAIVVYGEDPYAEGVGDRAHVDYAPADGLELLQRLKAAGIPTVSVFISGRPLWVNPELNASDAFVAAWLPGTEGGGIADLLIAGADGNPRHDFSGRLSFSWPAAATQVEVNVGDADYQPLFAYGHGLSYGAAATVGPLPEDPGFAEDPALQARRFIEYGDPVGAWRLHLADSGGEAYVSDGRGQSPDGALSVAPADREVQEDTLMATWAGPGRLLLDGPAADLRPREGENLALELQYEVLDSELTRASLALAQAELDVTVALTAAAGAGWRTSTLRADCFGEQGADLAAVTRPLTLSVEGSLALRIGSAKLVAAPPGASCEL
jgi:beta-glucosidase